MEVAPTELDVMLSQVFVGPSSVALQPDGLMDWIVCSAAEKALLPGVEALLHYVSGMFGLVKVLAASMVLVFAHWDPLVGAVVPVMYPSLT